MLFSFDVTAIDLVLMVAVLVLLTLFIAQRRGQLKVQSQLPAEGEETREKLVATNQGPIEERPARSRSGRFQRCVHDFGHLRNLPKNTPVPDECFGCPKVTRCLFPD